MKYLTIVMNEIILPCKIVETTELVPDFSKANFEKLGEFLQDIDWFTELEGRDVNDGWTYTKEAIDRAVEECVPKKVRRLGNKPLWMKPDILKSYSEKAKAVETLPDN